MQRSLSNLPGPGPPDALLPMDDPSKIAHPRLPRPPHAPSTICTNTNTYHRSTRQHQEQHKLPCRAVACPERAVTSSSSDVCSRKSIALACSAAAHLSKLLLPVLTPRPRLERVTVTMKVVGIHCKRMTTRLSSGPRLNPVCFVDMQVHDGSSGNRRVIGARSGRATLNVKLNQLG